MKENKKIIITGATGFIGQELVKLIDKNKYDLHVIIRDQNKAHVFDGMNLKILKGSLNDADFLKKSLSGQSIIIHLAAMLNEWGASRTDFCTNNVDTTINLINNADKNLLEKFIYLSSVHVYGANFKNLPVNENQKPCPVTLYAQSKLEAENLIINSGIPYTILRSSMVYGPSEKSGFMTNLINSCNKKMVFVPGNGQNKIHLIYIDDLVRAILIALEQAPSNDIFNIAGQEVITLDLLLKKVKTVSRRSFDVIYIPKVLLFFPTIIIEVLHRLLKLLGFNKKPFITKDVLDIVTGNRCFDTTKARQKLGFAPQVSLDAGLRDIIKI